MRQSKLYLEPSNLRIRRGRTERQPELGQAKAQFDEAQKALQQGDWEKFGKAMEVLKQSLSGAVPPAKNDQSKKVPRDDEAYRLV